MPQQLLRICPICSNTEGEILHSIVISGASSLIGSALALTALTRGFKVICFAQKNSARLKYIPNEAKAFFTNLDEYKHLEINETCDLFFHLAWQKTDLAKRDDIYSQMQNIQYTLDAVHLAKRLGCKKFVGIGSQAEYGLVSEPLTASTPANPQSGYGIAKLAAGQLSRLLASQLGMQHNWVRILSVYGFDGNENSIINYCIKKLQAGEPPELTPCEQVWDFLHSIDSANALLDIGEKGIDGKTYVLGSGEKRKLKDYISAIKNIVNPNIALQFGKKEYYPHQPMYLCADISELANDTGWKPKISFEDGIKMMLKN